MNKTLLGKILKDLQAQIVCWSLGMGLLLFLTITIYPSISTTYSTLMDDLPEGIRAFMGMDFPLNTLEGYLNAEFFTYAPIALAVFSVLSGTGSIISEENNGTLDLLLAQPISRLKLIITKLMGLALANIIVVAILIIMFWGAVIIGNVEFNVGRNMGAFILLWPFLTAISFLSLLLSLVLSSRILAGTIMAVLLVASFILDSLANLISGLEPLRPIYLSIYFQGDEALVTEVSLCYSLGLTIALFGAFLINIWLFLRRDIGIQRSIQFRSLIRLAGWRSLFARN